MRSFAALFIALTVALLLPGRHASAASCGSPDQHGTYRFSGDTLEPTKKPLDAQPWVSLLPDEVERMLEDPRSCVITSIDSGRMVSASVDVVASSHVSFPTRGCNTGEAFLYTIARVIPDDLLEANSEYQITCRGEFALEPEWSFVTGDQMAAPVPEFSVEGIRADEWCNDKRVMQVSIRGLDSRFWEEGGVITAEYEGGAIDWIGTAFSDPTSARLELPDEGEERVVFTAISGAGIEGPAVQMDVSHIAGSRAVEGCATARHSNLSFELALGLLLLLLRARPRRWPKRTPS